MARMAPQAGTGLDRPGCLSSGGRPQALDELPACWASASCFLASMKTSLFCPSLDPAPASGKVEPASVSSLALGRPDRSSIPDSLCCPPARPAGVGWGTSECQLVPRPLRVWAGRREIEAPGSSLPLAVRPAPSPRVCGLTASDRQGPGFRGATSPGWQEDWDGTGWGWLGWQGGLPAGHQSSQGSWLSSSSGTHCWPWAGEGRARPGSQQASWFSSLAGVHGGPVPSTTWKEASRSPCRPSGKAGGGS